MLVINKSSKAGSKLLGVHCTVCTGSKVLTVHLWK